LSYFLPDYVDYLKEVAASVDNVESAKAVKAIRYYDLYGRQCPKPEGVIYIQETEYEDGSVTHTKHYR
ncbi:MAG: hypothetical protein IJ417_03535, partial [Bacteroidaceae bacterium]|nr:hypothetical protein [Bacteroidaceae bacterium]